MVPVSAAVIPLGFDKQDVGGPAAGLPAASPLDEMSGQWVGKDAGGRDVKLELHVAGNAIAGSATLAGAMPDSAAAQLRVAQVALDGRTLVFAVGTRPCGNKATYAVLTIVSPESAQLDLETGSRPITFKLSKVG